jgi:hypothetical protein
VFKKIAVGTNGSETAGLAVEMALDIAEHHNAELLLFSAYRRVGSARIEPNRKRRRTRSSG